MKKNPKAKNAAWVQDNLDNYNKHSMKSGSVAHTVTLRYVLLMEGEMWKLEVE